MERWSNERIQHLRENFVGETQHIAAAHHIQELQEAVEKLREDLQNAGFGYRVHVLNTLFWPADSDTLDDPDDNLIGHEW